MYGYVELHGHRGARGLRPENTLPALMHALELGVDVLEFDLVMSADGELVLRKGGSAFVPAGAPLAARGPGVLYRATTNLR